jgi:AcrR family transcriptional regulator
LLRLRGEAAAAAPLQARSIEKRRRILEAGRRVFGEKGYEEASIGEITSRAGVAAGAFYQFFSSKRQFLVELMNEFLGRLARLDLRPPSAGRDAAAEGGEKTGAVGAAGAAAVRATLRDFLAATFRMDAKHYGVVRAWQEGSLADAELRRMQREIEVWTDGRVLGVFRALERLPGARAGCDVQAFARMMNRHFWSMLARGSRMTKAELSRELDVSAEVIYQYLFGGV